MSEQFTERKPSGRLWTIRQLVDSAALPVSESTLRRMINEGKVIIRRVGSGRGSIRIPNSEVEFLTKADQN